jgi:hypothetical protein
MIFILVSLRDELRIGELSLAYADYFAHTFEYLANGDAKRLKIGYCAGQF